MKDLSFDYMEAVRFAFRHALVHRLPLHELRHRLYARPQPPNRVREALLAFFGRAPGNPHLSREIMEWFHSADIPQLISLTFFGIASTEPPPGVTPQDINW